MLLVPYEFYLNGYGGERIPEEDWKRVIRKANSYLDAVKHTDPWPEIREEAMRCLCEAAELIYQDDVNRSEHGGRDIRSENTDGYSVSYADGAGESLENRVYAVIRRYLAHTGLLYAGVRKRAYKCHDYDI